MCFYFCEFGWGWGRGLFLVGQKRNLCRGGKDVSIYGLVLTDFEKMIIVAGQNIGLNWVLRGYEVLYTNHQGLSS